MVGSASKIAIAYLFMLLIMRKMECSENRRNVKGASLLTKIKIPPRFENVRTDRDQSVRKPSPGTALGKNAVGV